MLDLKLILDNPEKIRIMLQNRGWEKNNIDEIVDNILNLGQNRSKLMTQVQQLENNLNKDTALFAEYIKEKKDITELKNNLTLLKNDIVQLNIKVTEINNQIENLLYEIPNVLIDDVPKGKDENDNVVLYQKNNLDFSIIQNPKPHYEIGVELDILDFNRAVKLSGSRFVVYKNEGARLVRALVNFMLDTHINNGYKELVVPTLVKKDMLYGTGQLPKFSEDSYSVNNTDLWLIATAEIPITNYYNNEILDLSQPQKFVGYTRCYRSEAGSGGKDTKGLIRSHEFHKVEIVKIVSEKAAYNEYQKTILDAQSILDKLKIPYQAVLLCSGDVGFSSQQTVDLELWLPSENKYRETSSISIFGTYQARRAMIRYKDENKKTKYAYTINGSGLAIDRVIAAILEIYQTEDGSINIPEALIPYMNNQKQITRR